MLRSNEASPVHRGEAAGGGAGGGASGGSGGNNVSLVDDEFLNILSQLALGEVRSIFMKKEMMMVVVVVMMMLPLIVTWF